MADDTKRRVAISLRPTHGTARQIAVRSVIPAEKREAEVFWVSVLLDKLPSFSNDSYKVVSNADDSHGQDDVLVEFSEGNQVGVQVTELTYELERTRQAQRRRFIEKAIGEIRSRGLAAHPPVVANCLISYETPKKAVDDTSHALVDEIANFIQHPDQDSRRVSVGSANVVFSRVHEGEVYVPQHNGVAVDCSLDELPRSLEVYADAAGLIRERKATSLSDWLVIWSSQFWRDGYWLGENLMQQMRILFADSDFQRVYFIESRDGEDCFESNLHVIELKS